MRRRRCGGVVEVENRKTNWGKTILQKYSQLSPAQIVPVILLWQCLPFLTIKQLFCKFLFQQNNETITGAGAGNICQDWRYCQAYHRSGGGSSFCDRYGEQHWVALGHWDRSSSEHVTLTLTPAHHTISPVIINLGLCRSNLRDVINILMFQSPYLGSSYLPRHDWY